MPVGIRFALPRLRDARERRGFTLDDLRERSGVAAASVSRLENAKNQCYPTTARKLAAALDVPVDALRGLEPLPWERQARLPFDEETKPAA